MQSAPIPNAKSRESHEQEHGEAVRAMFDRIAPTYDTLNRVLSFGVDTRWRKRAVRELARAPRGPLLDLCAGTLDLSKLLCERMPEREVTAADFSEEMLELGRDKAPRARRVVADAMSLPFADAEFAGVIAGFGIRNVGQPKVAAREVLRVLRPGGLFVTLEFFKPESLRAKAFHGVYARAVLPRVGAAISGERAAYAYLAESMKGFLTRTEYEEALRDVGFSRVRGYDLLLGIASIVVAEVAS
jgi:ubiquinone/menaquinone biosynthesis methyltransferase